MTRIRARVTQLGVLFALIFASAAPILAAGQADAQGGFVPADQLPAPESIPAAPLLLAAYAFVWVAVVAYVFVMWRRVGHVEREIAEMRRQIAAGQAASSGR